MRPRSRLVRPFRALTALLTVWCLGCSAFDPLISQLTGSPMMDCESQRNGSTGAVTATNVDQELSVRPLETDDLTRATACDCQCCLAPAPTALAVAPTTERVPEDLQGRFAAPTSIERTPLVPPPQAVA